MHSLKDIYTVGYGTSSSHTMAPRKAAEIFLIKVQKAFHYRVTLYGSLATTGKGHLTDMVINDVFRNKNFEILWEPQIFLPHHPNALKFEATNEGYQLIEDWTAYSVGGGEVIDINYNAEKGGIYPLTTMDDILSWCSENGN